MSWADHTARMRKQEIHIKFMSKNLVGRETWEI